MRNPKLVPLARSFRQRPTHSEDWLWERLRDRRLDGLKFRRQRPRGPYVPDFVCEEARVVVELDGSGHDRTVERDLQRKTRLESMGYVVLRFGSEIRVEDSDEMLVLIARTCRGRIEGKASS